MNAVDEWGLPAPVPCRLCGAAPVWRVAERVYLPGEVAAVPSDVWHLALVCRHCGTAPCVPFKVVVERSGLLKDDILLWNSANSP